MQELLARYKNIPLVTRAVIGLALGSGLMWFMSTGEQLAKIKREYEQAQDLYQTTENKAKKSQKHLENNDSADLRAEISKKNKEYQEAQDFMPESFLLDDILIHISAAVARSGVKLISFRPSDPESRGGDFKYYALNVGLSIQGSYKQCGYFYDLLSRMKTMVQIQDIEMSQMRKSEVEGSDTDQIVDQDGEGVGRKHLLERLRDVLSNYMVKSEAKLVVFSRSSE